MRSLGLRFVACLLVAVGLWNAPVAAQTPVVLDPAQPSLALARHLEILEDPGGRLTIDDVASPAFASKFMATERNAINAGYSASAFWFRFEARNPSEGTLDRLLEIPSPILGDVTFFHPADDGSSRFGMSSAGDALPFGERVILHRHFVFPVRLPARATRVFYLRVRTTGSLSFSATLWEAGAHARKDRLEYGFLGLYYGLLLMLLLYNGISFLGTRDRSFLYFLGFVTCLGLFQASADGLGQEFIWGNAPFPGQIPRNVAINLAAAFAGYFARDFLSLKRYSRRIDFAVKWLTYGYLSLAAAMLLFPSRIVIEATAMLILVGVFIGLIAPVDAFRAGYRPALLFILAWVPLLISGLVLILRFTGLAPDTFLTQYFMHGGMAIQSLFFSLALVERIDALRRETAIAQYEADLREERMEISLIRNTELEDALQQREVARLEIERQKAELEDAYAKLREVDRIKADFTAMLVHDLKSPLAGVRNACEVIQPLEAITDPNRQELVRNVHSTLDGTITLIDDLLEIYRSESLDVALDRDRLDLKRFLDRAIGAARLNGTKNNLSVELELPEKLPEIIGDVRKLDRVFSNLLSNAVKFTAPGGRITVSARTVAGSGVEAGITFVEVAVTDTGDGIPPAELPYLFDPYRQGASRNRQLGVGLGLAIVKRIVAAHEGNISVRSQVGVGSTFLVTLPALA